MTPLASLDLQQNKNYSV